MADNTAVADGSLDLDNLAWDDWTPAQICSIENGADCAACEG